MLSAPGLPILVSASIIGQGLIISKCLTVCLAVLGSEGSYV